MRQMRSRTPTQSPLFRQVPVFQCARVSPDSDPGEPGCRSVRPVYAVVPGVARLGDGDARPDLHVVGPLLERVARGAVELEEDAVDRVAVDADVRAESVDQLLADRKRVV